MSENLKNGRHFKTMQKYTENLGTECSAKPRHLRIIKLMRKVQKEISRLTYSKASSFINNVNKINVTQQ